MRWLTFSSLGSSLVVPFLAVGAASAQTVTFRPPEDIINHGTCGDWPFEASETDVAVGKSDVMAVWLHGTKDIAFAMRSSALPAGTWTCPALFPKEVRESACFGPLPFEAFDFLSFPSVAYSPETAANPECYMACALGKFVEEPSGDKYTCVVVSYYEPGAPNPAWSRWTILDLKMETCFEQFCSLNRFNKPFITAGAPDEFYVVYIDELGNCHYSHTTNGGRTRPTGPTSTVGDWICGQDILVNGSPVGNGFAIQPTALDGTDDLFCVYFSSNTTAFTYRFLRGIDHQVNGQFDTTVEFQYLFETAGVNGQPLTLDYDSDPASASALLPGNPNFKYVPQIAVDKTGVEPDHFYSVYVIAHEARSGSNTNVGTFLNVAVETPGVSQSTWAWMHPDTGVPMDDDPLQTTSLCSENPAYPGLTDQWLPMLALDKQGRAHTIFYDDRDFDQKDGSPGASCPDARWNLTYSVTPDQGATFTDHPRPAPSGESAWLDYSFSYNGPRDYNGLDFTTKQGAVYLWATVCGTSAAGQPPKNSVIWAQLIIVQ